MCALLYYIIICHLFPCSIICICYILSLDLNLTVIFNHSVCPSTPIYFLPLRFSRLFHPNPTFLLLSTPPPPPTLCSLSLSIYSSISLCTCLSNTLSICLRLSVPSPPPYDRFSHLPTRLLSLSLSLSLSLLCPC